MTYLCCCAGLDGQGRRLVFFRPSTEARRNIKLPMGTLLRQGRLTIRTDLQDNHVYAMDRSVLEVLQSKPSLANIKQVRAASQAAQLHCEIFSDAKQISCS